MSTRALAFASVLLLASPALAQTSKDVTTLKAENADVKEQLRQMQEQQKALLEQLDRLQKRLDASTGSDVAALKADTDAIREQLRKLAEQQKALSEQLDRVQQEQTSLTAKIADRYEDGIVVGQSADDSRVPFLFKFNVNTQVRYLNTTNSDDTFADHLGTVHDVHTRNDITVNRSMFILGGYVFDKRLRYSCTVWTSAGAASIIVAGTIGWVFNKGLTLTGGYTGVPGSRSLVNTFPFYTSTDRSMTDNFFRPGFTQGLWAFGEPVKGVNYLAFIGNGLNTLNVSASKIDTHLLFSGSVWWEPLGDYGPAGKGRNMYDDYFAEDTTRVRVGTAFTRSREDRFSNLDTSSPENTSLYNSDGVLTFATGAFAPGVTVQQATYRLSAIDFGLKRKGLAINGQYFFRTIDNFDADGPLPLTSTYDHGFEMSAGYFVIPKVLEPYVRGGKVWGEFNNPWEYGAGVKWHFLPTERLWINAELMNVNRSPYSGAFTPYTAGMKGWVPMIQTILAF
jgi:hypothetical protein